MTLKYPKVCVCKDKTVYVYFYLNNKRYRLYNGNKIGKKIFPNSSIRKNIIGEVTGFDRDETSNACELVSSLTGDNTREVVSFGTEAGLFQEIGISTVVCGPGSIEQAHKIDEFIILDELKKCLNLLEGIKDNSIVN